MASLTASVKLGAARRVSFRTQAKAPRAMRATRLVCRAASKDAVLVDVCSVIKEQLGDEVEVTAASTFSDLGADSLDTVEIMMALEDKFKVEIAQEEAEKLTNVDDVAALIASKM